MALQVQQFIATIPAGTPQSSLVTVGLDIDNWELEQIDLEVPAGPAGLMGFYVANNDVQWIPRQVGTFLVWDDVQQSWPVSGYPNASGWQIVGYNTGTYDHSITVRMHVSPPATADTGLLVPQVTFVATAAETPSAVTLPSAPA